MKKIYRMLKSIYFRFKTNLILKKYGKPNVKNSVDTVDYLLEHDKISVSRFGDGEFDIMAGKSIKFQEFEPNLAKKLQLILSTNEKNLMVCIPAIYDFKILNTLKYHSKIFWLDYICHNYTSYLPYLNLNKQYYDACFSRPYIRYKKECNDISNLLFSKIKMLWNQKKILLIEGEYSRLGVGNDLFQEAKSIRRILCPSKNAFSKYDEILSAIKKHYADDIVIISLGPTATVLAYDLLKENISAIDLGHIDVEYEWYLSQAEEKVDIENKVVNELNIEKEMQELKNEEYNQSIIEVIQ